MIGSMQEQMAQMGDELTRLQQVLNRTPAAQTQLKPQPLLTSDDQEKYGPELIDFAQRAAREAVAPQLTALEQENQRLRRDVVQTKQGAVYETLDGQLPNWRTINTSPRFLQWLRLPDLYSGRVRGELLKEAFTAASAPRVLQFFKGFITDEEATGNAVPISQQQPGAQPSPRIAAVPLETLAAPGAARPAPGNAQVPADKPIYTRQQIASFYTQVRQGYYAGREQEKAQLEADIFAAQREGRVR